MLLVLSDHGQTLGGDHGGSSPDEVNTVLAAFNLPAWWAQSHCGGLHRPQTCGQAPSPTNTATPDAPTGAAAKEPDPGACSNGQKPSPDAALASAGVATGDAGDRLGSDAVGNGQKRSAASNDHQPPQRAQNRLPRQPVRVTMEQLDLTATFAALMGLPVPYSNVGGLDAALWRVLTLSRSHTDTPTDADAPRTGTERLVQGGAHQQARDTHTDAHATTIAQEQELEALLLISRQVFTYLQHYMRVAGLPSQTYRSCLERYQPVTAYAHLVPHGVAPASAAPDTHNYAPGASRLASEDDVGSTGAMRPPGEQLPPWQLTRERLVVGIAACRTFLSAAASVTREKFTGCSVPRMVLGTAVVTAGVVLLLWEILSATFIPFNAAVAPPLPEVVVKRSPVERPSPARPFSPAHALRVLTRAHPILRPCVLGPAAVCVFQSCSLFGLDWMMAEGRVQCACVVGCALTLSVGAAWEAMSGRAPHATHAHPSQPLARASVSNGAAAADTQSTPHATAPQVVHQQASPTPNGAPLGVPTAATPAVNRTYSGRETFILRSLLSAVALSSIVVLCVVLLARYGLVDRGSSDPHNKAAQSTTLEDLLGVTGHTGHTNHTSTMTRAETNVARASKEANSTYSWAWVELSAVAVYGLLVLFAWRCLRACEHDVALLSSSVSAEHTLSGADAAGARAAWSTARVTSQSTVHAGRVYGGAQDHTWYLTLVCVSCACTVWWWALQIAPAAARDSDLALLDIIHLMQSAWATQRVFTLPASLWSLTVLTWSPLILATATSIRQWFRCMRVASVVSVLLVVWVWSGMGSVFLSTWLAMVDGVVASARAGQIMRWLMGGMEPMAGAVWEPLLRLPLRLLLPRVVYGSSGVGVAHLCAAALQRLCARSTSTHQVRGQSGGFWLAAVLGCPVMLLLGRRGLRCVPLGAVAVTASIALTGRVAALAAGGVPQPTTARQAHPFGPEPNSTQSDTPNGVGPPAVGTWDAQGWDTALTDACAARVAGGIRSSLLRASSRQDASRQMLALRAAAPACVGGALTLHALSCALFFATGHFCEFTGLQYASPFIGFDSMQWWISPVLLTLNTFGGMLLCAIAISSLVPVTLAAALHAVSRAHEHQNKGSGARDERSDSRGQVALAAAFAAVSDRSAGKNDHTTPCSVTAREASKALGRLTVCTFLFARCLTLCMLMVCATVLHSHILVWAIIAPRYVFEVFFLAMVACGLGAGSMLS